MLSQLIYVSNRKPICTDAEIERILNSCKKNNPSLDITGLLLYSDTKFIQVVEGNSKVIGGLYDKIREDHRHANVMMVSFTPIKERAFPSWHMASKKISENEVDYKTDITTEDKAIFEKILSGQEENGAKALSVMKKLFS